MMDIRAIFMGLAFAAMWSSAFSTARIIVQEMPPLSALALRFLISGLFAIAVAFALGQRLRLNRPQWRATVLFGICQNVLYLGLNFVAMQWIEASLAAIIASSMPLLVAAASRLFFRESLPLMGILGLVAGFSGVALIMGERLSGGGDATGIVLCLTGALALAFATLTLRSTSTGSNLLMIVGLQMLVGSAVLAIPALSLENWAVIWNWRLAAAFAYTTLVPGVAATWVWFLLVRRIGPTRAATFHFLNPFLGVAVAAGLLGEALGPNDILGVIIITGGILAVQLSRQRPRSPGIGP